MKNLRILMKSKLAKRLVLYVLLFSSTITLIFTSLQLYMDYRSGITLIQQEVDQISSTSLKSLEENLWLLNTNSIQLMLEGILQNKDIAYLEVTDENGKLITAQGEVPKENFQQYTFPLSYSGKDKTIYLGNFRVVATLENIYSELINRVTYLLVSQSVKTFVVSAFIIFIVWSLISRHLLAVQRYTSKLRLENRPKDLVLDRSRNKWTENDELSNLVAALNMMRRQVYESYSRIEHQSLHDPLTRLPNRRYLENRLKRQAEVCARSKQYGALLFLDLDHFKLLNESLGHTIGDQILITVSERLLSLVRKGDLIARIGGDEFIIMLTGFSAVKNKLGEEVQKIAAQIQASISQDMCIEGKKYKISASIGISLFSGSECYCETLLKQADNALHESKKQGRNRITLFHPEMQKKADIRLETEQNLHVGIQKKQFIVHYQPKYDQSGNICSAEALVRWKPSTDEMIPPNIFIPIAEETGLIVEIGSQIISMVFRMVSENSQLIERTGLQNISINVSSRQFINPGFAEQIVQEARNCRVDPEFFILEITEEAVVKDIEATIQTMHTLKKFGFRLSIDDFGTGYSSLQYLKDFPLDELKIDKSFIDHIVENKNDHAIALSIIEMAKNLGLDVVAEGVETEAQFNQLLAINCHIFQGYLFSKPLETSHFLQLLET